MRVAKPRCHVVRTMAVAVVSFQIVAVGGYSNGGGDCVRNLKSRVYRMYLLNRMTEEDREIHALLHRQHCFQASLAVLIGRTRRILPGEGQPAQAQASQRPGCG